VFACPCSSFLFPPIVTHEKPSIAVILSIEHEHIIIDSSSIILNFQSPSDSFSLSFPLPSIHPSIDSIQGLPTVASLLPLRRSVKKSLQLHAVQGACMQGRQHARRHPSLQEISQHRIKSSKTRLSGPKDAYHPPTCPIYPSLNPSTRGRKRRIVSWNSVNQLNHRQR